MNTLSTAVRHVATVAAVSAVGLTGMAAPALAASGAFQDARGDMSQGADIQKVRVVNGEKKLRINVVHRDLVRSWRSGSSVAVYIDTDRARTGPEFAFVGGTFEGGDYSLVKADGFGTKNSRQVSLNGGSYRMTLDYVDDVARIGIDQVVLKNPSKVRVEVKTGAELLPEGSTGEGTNEVDWLGTPESFTTWVARG